MKNYWQEKDDILIYIRCNGFNRMATVTDILTSIATDRSKTIAQLSRSNRPYNNFRISLRIFRTILMSIDPALAVRLVPEGNT
jgi:hypothetical protein